MAPWVFVAPSLRWGQLFLAPVWPIALRSLSFAVLPCASGRQPCGDSRLDAVPVSVVGQDVFLHRAAQICINVQASHGKMLKDFVVGLEGNAEVATLRAEVEAFASSFPIPSFNDNMNKSL